MKKIKIFPKMFIQIFSVLAIIIILVHSLVFFIFPKTYLETRKEKIYNIANEISSNMNGKEIKYTVEEVVPEGYTASYNTETEGKTIITNTHEVEKTSYSVEKIWNDNNNQDGKRPESIQVQLKANGNNKGEAITLNEENNWKNTWTNLPKY